MMTIPKKYIFFSLLILSLWGFLSAHNAFAREVFICQSPAATEDPFIAYINPDTCNAFCSTSSCVSHTVSDSVFSVWICNGDRTIIKDDVTACRVACDPANLATPPPEKQCTESFISAADPPQIQPPGGGQIPPTGQTPLPQASGPDGGLFQPLALCGLTDPSECTLCEAFRLIHRVIQFLFYAIMLPLVAIAFIIGGIILLTAAGNETKITQGKSIVWNTFIGFLIAFAAWLVISTIIVNITPGTIPYPKGANLKWYQFPDCVPGSESPIDIKGKTLTVPPTTCACNTTSACDANCSCDPNCKPPTGGSCAPITTPGNPCSIDNLANTCFGSNAENASRMCNRESAGGRVESESGSDKCSDGASFSVGLFQINVIANANLIDSSCSQWYAKVGNKTPQGDCVPGFRRADGVCLKWNCKIVDQDLYKKCIALAKDIEHDGARNIQAACALSNNGSNFRQHWGGKYGSAFLCQVP